MKQTIKELANETTTSTTGVSTVQGKEWLKVILTTAKKKMFFEQFAYVSTMQQGNKDHAVPICTTHKTFSDTTTEATARTLTEIDNVTAVVFTPTIHKFGAAITKQVVRTSQVDYIQHARDEMAYYAALSIDTAFATAIAAASSPAGTLYGGTATSTATLAAGDILTPTLVNKARRYLKAIGWYPEPDRPFVLFIPAVCEEQLLNDSQFTNAAEYGTNEVVMNGEIGKYLAVKVISTEQCPSASNWGAGGNLAGHTCFLIKGRVAYGIVYGVEPTLDSEYKKDEGEYKLYLDVEYQCKTLQENAIVLVKVLDV